jgi:hypothetical protein
MLERELISVMQRTLELIFYKDVPALHLYTYLKGDYRLYSLLT